MKSITSKAHTAPYIIHKYFARRPYSVFEHIISNYTKKGDVVYDPFAGGGVTVYESIKQNRRAIGCDINPLSSFISERMLIKNEGTEFQESVNYLKKYLHDLYTKYYSVKCSCGESAIPEVNEAFYLAKCPFCNSTIEFSNRNKIKTAVYHCSNCNTDVTAHKCTRIGYEYLSAQYYCKCQTQLQKRELSKLELEYIKKNTKKLLTFCKKNDISWPTDKIPDNWERTAEDCLIKKGFMFFCDLFTLKNLLINACLLNEIKKLNISKNTYLNLRLIFSASLKDTSKLSMVTDNWQQGKPVTWSKHAYWIPSQFCEVNIYSALKRAIDRFQKSCDFNQANLPDVKVYKKVTSFFDYDGLSALLLNHDSSDIKIPKNSVDLILTDPPYGSNVQYNELTSFWHVWNRDIYKSKFYEPREAIVNRKKSIPNTKTFDHYENVLTDIMKKNYSVLKNDGLMILTFNNNNFNSWISILFSISKAGFSIEPDKLIFQPGIRNYRQTAHTISNGTVHGDFILFFRKNKHKPKRIHDIRELTLNIRKAMNSIVNEKPENKEEFHEHFVFYYKKLLPELWEYLNSLDENLNIEEISDDLLRADLTL